MIRDMLTEAAAFVALGLFIGTIAIWAAVLTGAM